MLKTVSIIVIVIAFFLVATRLAITSSGFLQGGIMEGIQACKSKDDCVWTPTTCCSCKQGGGEIVINSEKEWLYKALIKPICLGEQSCFGENACHYEEIFCDRTCKFGKPTFTKPLLTK